MPPAAPPQAIVTDPSAPLIASIGYIIELLKSYGLHVALLRVIDGASQDAQTQGVLDALAAIRAADIKYTITLNSLAIFYKLAYYGYQERLFGFEQPEPFVLVGAATFRYVDLALQQQAMLQGAGRSIKDPGTAPPPWQLPANASLDSVLRGLSGCLIGSPSALNRSELFEPFLAAYTNVWGSGVPLVAGLEALYAADAIFHARAVLDQALVDGNLCAFEQGPYFDPSLVLSYFRNTTAMGPGGAIRMLPNANERDTANTYSNLYYDRATNDYVARTIFVKPPGTMTFLRADTQAPLPTLADMRAAAQELLRFAYPGFPTGRIPGDGLGTGPRPKDTRLQTGLGVGLGVGLGMLVVLALVALVLSRRKSAVQRLVELDPRAVALQAGLIDLPSHLESSDSASTQLQPRRIAIGHLRTGMFHKALVLVQELPGEWVWDHARCGPQLIMSAPCCSDSILFFSLADFAFPLAEPPQTCVHLKRQTCFQWSSRPPPTRPSSTC